MICIENERDWLLLTHPNHAALAGEFARHWKNDQFSPPAPFAHILDAVSRHDDSWSSRDARPFLTPEMHPSAFTKELVGTYDAFEDIDLEDYLAVRGAATEAAAKRDPYSAVLISMHTVNLLNDQADLSTLCPEQVPIHKAFINGQRARQVELKASLRSLPDIAPLCSDEHFQRGFEFLQACDSFSLLVGVAYADEAHLRHSHPTRQGGRVEIRFLPQGNHHYILDPWPLDEPKLQFTIPYRRVAKSVASSLENFQAAYTKTADELTTITLSTK